ATKPGGANTPQSTPPPPPRVGPHPPPPHPPPHPPPRRPESVSTSIPRWASAVPRSCRTAPVHRSPGNLVTPQVSATGPCRWPPFVGAPPRMGSGGQRLHSHAGQRAGLRRRREVRPSAERGESFWPV